MKWTDSRPWPQGAAAWRTSLATLAVAAIAAAGTFAATGSAGAAPKTGTGHLATGAGARPAAAVKPPATYTITLITGDKVRATVAAGGALTVTVPPGGSRPGVTFTRQTMPGPDKTADVFFIPSDAIGRLDAGTLDRRLFDVSELIRDGYDTPRTGLPLIVSYQGAASVAPKALTQGGATTRRALPGVNGAAITEPPASAGSFWKSLTGSTASGPTAMARTLSTGIAHVWLDAKMQAADDVSGAQIGAPTAYQDGYTGDGVLVADLDSGYDQNHADLSGAVAQAQDFTGSATGVQDVFGHGTHTASIIAGSGADSGGKYRGVAYGAKLLVGKVLGDDGSGSESDIIAGMQWAVDQHAKVVNMSLGGYHGCSTGTDPVSLALDSLSASSGTLFVVAAGNTGQFGRSSLEEPGSADAALTVGAVDANNQLASFSSTGPRCGDDAVKPDITAPGVGIVAARAAGTSLGQDDGIAGDGPVDANYTRASGTSMSTPHVTAAAAILAQQHPDWTGTQLKAALMDSAAPTAGLTPYQQGAGRVDVARAVTQNVTSDTGSISEYLSWPHAAPTVKTVTYTNSGTTSQTLDLALTMTGTGGAPAPSGMFTLPSPQVTVPAGGSVQVPVTTASTGATVGLYSGRLTATSADGSTVLQTAIGVYEEPESYDLTVTEVDRTGAVDTAPNLAIGHLVDDSFSFGTLQPDGSVVARLVKGAYEIWGSVNTPATDSAKPSVTLAADPGFTLDKDTSVVLDARAGVPVQVSTPHAGVAHEIIQMTIEETVAGLPGVYPTGVYDGTTDAFAVPQPKVTDRPYAFDLAVSLDNAASTASQTANLTYSLLYSYPGGIPSQLNIRVDDSKLAVAHDRFNREGTEPIKHVYDYTYSASATGTGPASTLFEFDFTLDPSGAVTEYYSPALWREEQVVFYGDDLDGGGEFEQQPYRAYRAGCVYDTTWGAAALGPVDNSIRSGDTILPYTFPTSISVAGSQSIDLRSPANGVSGTTTLSQGSTVIGTADVQNPQPYAVPSGDGVYTIHTVASRSAAWTSLGTHVDASWTFHSATPADDGMAYLPLWSVRTRGGFNGADQAPAGVPFPVTIAPDLPQGAPTAPVKTIHVAASFDDGATWHDLTLVRDGASQWTTTITAPATATFVSLKSDLTDSAGNSTTQTVIRAYGLYPTR